MRYDALWWAGPEISDELVKVLRKRLDEATLDIITVMLVRNCKLTPADVEVISLSLLWPSFVCDRLVLSPQVMYRLSRLIIFAHPYTETDICGKNWHKSIIKYNSCAVFQVFWSCEIFFLIFKYFESKLVMLWFISERVGLEVFIEDFFLIITEIHPEPKHLKVCSLFFSFFFCGRSAGVLSEIN